MIGDRNDTWVSTRQIWNQHAYSINNVNDDGTIPKNPENSWQTHNTFRLNAFPEGEGNALAAPDLVASYLRLENADSDTTITARIGNGGAQVVGAGVNVAFYNGDPNEGGELLGTTQTNTRLDIGAFEDVNLTVPAGTVTLENIWVVADDDGTGRGFVNECDEENNFYHVGSQSGEPPEPPVNREPEFTSTPPEIASTNQTFRYDAEAQDADGDMLTYDLSLAPEGMAVDSASGIVVWNPTINQLGDHDVILRVQDGNGGVGLQAFQVTVGNNTAPIITSRPFGPTIANTSYNYDVDATDADGDTLTYSLLAHPNGVTIDKTSGLLSWTPTDSDVGDNFIRVRVDDSQGGFDTQSFTLPVLAATVENRPPIITNAPRDQIGLGQDYLFQIEAEDPDNDPLTYRLIEHPDDMTIDPNGLVKWPADKVQLGDYSFTVQVEDGRGAGVQATYTLTVGQQTIVNNPPEITSTPSFVATIGDQYLYEPEASDPDNDPIVWALVSGPEGLTLNETTGRVSWTPTTDQFGFHEVIIEAIDAQGAAFRQGFGINVSSTNTPPTVTSAPPTLAFNDTSYTYAIEANDPNGDALTYSLAVAPDGMTINENTGLIEWTPTAVQLGTQTVTVSVADGRGGFAEQTYTLDVASDVPNQPPKFTSMPGFGATANQTYTYQLEATDPENLTLRYELLEGPAGMRVDGTTGALTWTPTGSQLGSHVIKVAAFDPLDLGASQTFNVTVRERNLAPVLNNIPDTTVLIGDTYTFDLNVTDPDGDAVTYTLVNGPGEMTIDELGRLRWTPTADDVGTARIDLLVEDGRGGNFTFGYNLSVVADTTAPQVIVEASNNPVDIDESVTVQVRATDDVAVESIGLTVDGTPVVLDSNGSARLSFEAIGSVALVATALDTSGNAASTDFSLAVIDASDTDAPEVKILTPDYGDSITSFVDVVGTVTDDNLTSYTLTVTPFAGGPTTVLAEGTSEITEAVLGRFDGTLLRNDSYILELSAVDTGGNTASTSTLVDVEGDLKVGNYTLSFVDLSIPLTGIPIVVSRTYDTLNANVTDDFGYGWRMDLRDTDLTTNVDRSELQESGLYNPFFDGAKVYVSLPNGEREAFIFQPKPDPLIFIEKYQPRFVAADGDNTSVLTVDDFDIVRNSDGTYSSFVGGLPYNPASELFGSGNYTLTTKDGIKYTIDGDTGDLEKVTDRNGNTLTYTEGGVFSSTGKQVTFERDPQGRITAVIDPEGNRITYEYDALGDLVAVTDREGNTTRFDYDEDTPHFLEDVIDPLGRNGIRSEYQDGRLVKLFDFGGNEVELIHDPDNFVETVEDQFGNATVYEYDARGNVLTEIDALGNITRRTYDSNDNMLTETVEKDGVIFEAMTFTYDSRNNVLSETNALGHTTYFTYDSFGNILTTTDPSGQTVTNTYDAKGNLTKIEGQATGSLTLSYDPAGNLTSLTDSVGTTTFEYFSDGNIKSQTDALGTVTTYTYDNNGNQLTETTTQTTPDGVLTLVTTMEYDDEGRVVKVTDADGNFTETIYDNNGNRIEDIDALRRSTKYVYDERGQLVETIYPDETPEDLTDNPRTRTEYDEAGRVIAEYDELDRATRTVYDELGRATKIIYADDTPDNLEDNPYTETEYDAAGRVTAQIDERGNRTEFIYDEAGRLLETIYPDETPNDLTDNPRFTTVYDDAGRQTRQTDALGQTTRYLYDALGRSVGEEYDDGTTSSVKYDDAGRVIAQTNQDNKTTQFEYDDLGRLEAVIDALNQRTEYTYDEQGNLLTQKDARGNITRYEYDELGRRTATVLPEGQRSVTLYDALGNPIRTTDFNGDNIIYRYDERYRLVTKDLPGEEFDETYTYTDNGLLETVTDDRGTTRYEYDERNRLTQRQDPDGTTIAYSYDKAGNRTAVTIPSGTTDYTFDEQNRLKTVTDPDGGITTYFYNTVGNLERTEFPNSTVEIRQYDSLNRLVYIENSGPNGIINSFRYALNAAGHRTAVDEHDGRRVEYTYDDLYRLKRETIYDPGTTTPSRTIEYVYDEVGNRLSRDDSAEGTALYTYDNNDRLETATTNGVVTIYGYDNNGNTTSKTTNGTTITYDWNADNRLISADTDGDGTVDVVNQYNQNGIRVSQAANGEETRFLIDENRPYAQVLEEYTPGGVIIVSYVYGNDLISQNHEGEFSFYHIDGLGSTRTRTNESNTILREYRFDAYGRNIDFLTENSDTRFLYTGEQSDSKTQLQYLRARYYDPDLGRFLSRDFIDGRLKNPISRNKYIYAHDNPFNNVDPSGLITIAEMGEVVSLLGRIASIGARAYSAYEKVTSVWETIQAISTILSLGPSAASKLKIGIIESVAIVCIEHSKGLCRRNILFD
ncbi:RHS repeat-associated core domain protein [Leptolyngbya sp. PCC 7375]|nr:RHS repeat-associated core domain protein [Leptolyngbya sp. PCC 7375]